MPIYEYRCEKCNEEFETIVFGNDEDVTCPHCNCGDVHRLMSACGFKSGNSYTPSKGTSGCASCSSGNCSSCH
ncbi:MAG: zinc ribbon domain-containing protein [Desulfatiglandaceae bacterium]